MFIQGASLVAQWFHSPNEGGMDSAPGWGTKILHAVQHGQKKKKIIHSNEKFI